VQEIDDDHLPRSYKVEEIFCGRSTPPLNKLREVFNPEKGGILNPSLSVPVILATALVPRHIKTRILYKRNIYLTHFSDFVSDVLWWSVDLFCGRYELHEKLILPHEIHAVRKKGKNWKDLSSQNSMQHVHCLIRKALFPGRWTRVNCLCSHALKPHKGLGKRSSCNQYIPELSKLWLKESKPCKSKSKMGTHPSKVQGKREHQSTQPKEKTKTNNQQKSDKEIRWWPYVKWTHGYEMTINNQQ